MTVILNAAVLLIKMPNRTVLPSVETFCKLNDLPLHIYSAFTPKDIGCSDRPHHHSSFGRTLTCVEIAIAHSHAGARRAAFELDLDIVIILEDDADVLLGKSELIIKWLEWALSQPQKRIGIHLYPEQFGVLIKKSRQINLNRVILLPDFAVGYVLNRRSLKAWNRSSSRARKWVADWPLSAYKLRWYAPGEPVLTHPLNDFSISYAATGRTDRINSLSIWQRRMNVGTIRFLLFLFFSLFGRRVGSTPIPNERLRTILLTLGARNSSKHGQR
jgi:hypothetical protein